MDVTSKFYKLCEMVDDDLYRVSIIIFTYHNDSISLGHVIHDIKRYKIEKYSKAIDQAFVQSLDTLLTISNSMRFSNSLAYRNYLMFLLELNNINFLPHDIHKRLKQNDS